MKCDYLEGVRAKHGINLLGRDASVRERRPWRSAPAADWRALRVVHDRKRPALLTLEQLFEVMDNAGYGGQLAIAGYVDRDFCLPRQMTAVTLIGKLQGGIIDYLCGSGHTVTFDGSPRRPSSGQNGNDDPALRVRSRSTCARSVDKSGRR